MGSRHVIDEQADFDAQRPRAFVTRDVTAGQQFGHQRVRSKGQRGRAGIQFTVTRRLVLEACLQPECPLEMASDSLTFST